MLKTPTQFDIDWFNKSVDKSNLEGCWIWTGYKMKSGHGQYSFNGDNVYTHRFAYLTVNPNFDQTLQVCHKCDNPSCVNPSHMFLGTQSDNSKDMVSKKRYAVGQAVGGALSEEDVLKIIEMYKTGLYKQRTLGRKFGVNASQISRIVNGRRWGHLSEKVGTEIA